MTYKTVFRSKFLVVALILLILLTSCKEKESTEIKDIENLTLYSVRRWSKYGYIDNKGNIIIKPQFDFALDFSEGLAAVKKIIKWVILIKR